MMATEARREAGRGPWVGALKSRWQLKSWVRRIPLWNLYEVKTEKGSLPRSGDIGPLKTRGSREESEKGKTDNAGSKTKCAGEV